MSDWGLRVVDRVFEVPKGAELPLRMKLEELIDIICEAVVVSFKNRATL